MCSSGWVEAGLGLVGCDQEAVCRLVEGFRRLRLREAVHVGLGAVPPAVRNGSRKRDQRLPRIAALGEILVDGEPVADGVQPRSGDDHRLGPVADLALYLRRKMLEADPHLPADRVRVQLDKGFEQVFGLFAVVVRIVLDLLEQPPVGCVGAVIVQHIEDKTLLDRLPHAVEVERLELPVGALSAEQFQRLGFRCRGKGEG